MSTPTVSPESKGHSDIRPFHVTIPEEDLADLQRRIAAMRWPERETVGACGLLGRRVRRAVTVLPRELYQAPRSWVEQALSRPHLLPPGRPGQPLRRLARARA